MTLGAGGPATRARALALLCAGTVALAGASGCSGVHLSHPTRTAACAQALPVAFATVHSHGRLVGFRVVRRRSDLRTLDLALGGGAGPGARATGRAGRPPAGRGELRPRPGRPRGPDRPRPQAGPAAGPAGAPAPGGGAGVAQPARAACLAVFQGHYAARDVVSAPPGDRGRYAVLIIFIRHATVIRTRLVDVLPAPVRRLL